MVASVFDRVALWIGRVLLDGVAVSVIVALVVFLWEWLKPLQAPKVEPPVTEFGTAYRGFTVIRRRAR